MHRRRFFAMGALFVAALAFAQDETEFGEMTFCHFGPKFKLTFPFVRSERWKSTQRAGEVDLCTGNVKVQGVYWECTQPALVESRVTYYLNELKKQATIECQKHCERRAPGCVGKFIIPSRCGLQTDREDAVILGKRMGCRRDCQGQAFAYCSLYDSAFRSDDVERIAKLPPNCECRLKK